MKITKRSQKSSKRKSLIIRVALSQALLRKPCRLLVQLYLPKKMVEWTKIGQTEHIYYHYTSTPLFFFCFNNLTQLSFLIRLVTMLADLGQRGGLLRLVGKFALLWGGIRGAMSLTDKLISVFHFSERPLFQR